MPLSPTARLAQALIQRPSITPNDQDCQRIMAEYLTALGFKCEQLKFGEVTNLWATRGDKAPIFVFAGHTDVVPTGKESDWEFPPFAGEIRDGILHGRGAADMKGSLAAMMTATSKFVSQYPDHCHSIGFLITSDEEGPAIDGTVRVMETLAERNKAIDYCLVGEPTSVNQLGDMIKLGRRGSLSGEMIIHGKQGHVAYPHLADNPIHRCANIINDLTTTVWDKGNEHFPPTTFQIASIYAGTGASNVIPADVTLQFNFRFSPEVTVDALKKRVAILCQQHELSTTLNWSLSGHPFQTKAGELTTATIRAIQEITGLEPELSTTGGTSDGRFIAPTGAQVVELGPVNATIHKINEQVVLQDLDNLSKVYQRILELLVL